MEMWLKKDHKQQAEKSFRFQFFLELLYVLLLRAIRLHHPTQHTHTHTHTHAHVCSLASTALEPLGQRDILKGV